MAKLHINVDLTTDERRALRNLTGILGHKSQEAFVTLIIKEKIAQYNPQLTHIDQQFNRDRLDKNDKIE